MLSEHRKFRPSHLSRASGAPPRDHMWRPARHTVNLSRAQIQPRMLAPASMHLPLYLSIQLGQSPG